MKIAASDFLNAKPLVRGLKKDACDIFWGSPKECAMALEKGKADFALLPSIEYVRIQGLFILPGASISSVGPVQSVILFLSKELSQVVQIAVDERSRTALTLLKILSKEPFKISPEYIERPPDLKAMLKDHDAALLIGDQALEASLNFKGNWIDLGQAWYQWTHLPFTFAFWAGRSGVSSEILERVIASKEEGTLYCDRIAKEESKAFLSENFILDYLTKSICYEWSKSHEDGLKLFYQWAFFYGLIDRVPEMKFYDIEAYHF